MNGILAFVAAVMVAFMLAATPASAGGGYTSGGFTFGAFTLKSPTIRKAQKRTLRQWRTKKQIKARKRAQRGPRR